ncbi:MAG: GyrI-like domain-containing protein [Bacteroidetes bacterium]|nr:GyrI-like domain-containing protein [Bacteroidota bacterium]
MHLTPRIETISQKLLIGMRRRMSLAKNEIPLLWKSFMPRRNEVQNKKNPFLYSIEVYDDLSYFKHFNPSLEFDKWAAVEVSTEDEIPSDMEIFIIPHGSYAIFLFKGSEQEVFSFYAAIFNEWLPSTNYELDNRPHFACMGEQYKKGDPNSEEEIYIPIKLGI